MRSTRALIASIGAGVSLVAAAALMLLTVSAVLAIEGWPGLGDAADSPALVVDDAIVASGGPADATGSTRPVVLRHPRAARPKVATSVAPARAKPTHSLPVREVKSITGGEIKRTAKTAEPTVTPVPLEARGPSPAPRRPQTGDELRKVGDGLSGTVQDTGSTLQRLTAPVSPQVGQTLKDLTNYLAGVLQQSTGLLGTTLDKLLPATAQKPAGR